MGLSEGAKGGPCLRFTGAWLLFVIGTLHSNAAFAGQGVWTSGGPYGGTVSALAIAPLTPSTLYAGTSVGVFKSSDSGGNWVAANSGMRDLSVSALAIDPVTASTLYAGTLDGGVFKSMDSGGAWAASNTGMPGPPAPEISALAVDPVTPSTLYAGSLDRGLFKSLDSGATWTRCGPMDGNVYALAVNPVTPSTLYAGTIYGVYKSTDSGGTWNRTELSAGYVYALAIDPTAPSVLYAGSVFGVFRSADSGGTWGAASAGLTALGAYSLAINPATPSTLYVGTQAGGVFRSTDSGATWAAVNAGLSVYLVKVLALDPTGATTLYAGSQEKNGVWQSTPPSPAGFIPIVLDVVGRAHYTSELQITNLGAASATVRLAYTSSIGSGSGTVYEVLPAGQQVVYPDAISYLRGKGVPIPASGAQGGTLLISAPVAGIHATIRTSSETVDPQPAGRAGLAYTEIYQTGSVSFPKFVFGLRANDAERSNLAVFNMGADPVSLKVTLVSGVDGSLFELTRGIPLSVPGYGWYQYNDVLNAAGFSSGHAVVEWASGGFTFGAYGVVNDQRTNDGSFIPAVSGETSGTRFTIPVLVETGSFESELILTNLSVSTVSVTARYVESLSPAKGAGGTATLELLPGRQTILPKAIEFLRSKGVGIGSRGEASYAGGLQIQVSGLGPGGVFFAGARTSALSPAGGEYGVFYPAVDPSQEFSETAFILGLKADINKRSNVAIIHTGDEGSGPITLELQVLDGSEGGRAVGESLSMNLNPGEWTQPPGFFASGGVPNGYVRIRRTSGNAPWYAYGVINDGGQPGQGTGDGSYIPGVRP